MGGPSHRACISAALCNFIRVVKLDTVTFWNVSEHKRTEHRIQRPTAWLSSCQHGTSRQSISLRVCHPMRACTAIAVVVFPPPVFSVALGR